MRHRSIKSRAGRVMLGAVLAGALSGAGASIARATLTLDLEAGSGNPNSPVTTANVATAGGTVTLNVYAVVSDGAGSASADGLGGLFASFDAAGAAGSGMSLSLASPFAYSLGSAASNGSSYSYTDTAGTTHVGVGNYNGTATGGPTTPTYDSTTPNNWAFAAYLNNNGTNVSSIFTGGTALTSGNGAYYDIGTLTLTTSGSAANGSTSTVTGYGRTQQAGNTMVAALWTENGTVETPAAGTAIAADDSVTVTVGTSGPVHNPGDVNDDGHVDNSDLTIVIQNWNKPAAGLTWEQGNLTGDATIDNSDLTEVIQNWNKTYNTGSVILAPEPASLGLLGGIAMLFCKRNRRQA